MSELRSAFILIITFIILFCGIKIYFLETERRKTKEDLVEISKIKYGFFNVDRWEEILAEVLSKKLAEFDFKPDQREAMKEKISAFLLNTFTDFENRYHKEKQESLLGVVQSGVISFTGAFDKIKRDIPVFTDQIITFLSSSQNREKIKEFLVAKLNEYKENTFSKVDYTAYDHILQSYGYQNAEEGKAGLQMRINGLQDDEWT